MGNIWHYSPTVTVNRHLSEKLVVYWLKKYIIIEHMYNYTKLMVGTVFTDTLFCHRSKVSTSISRK